MSSAFTIIINAAGIGARLGMNKPKCLIEVNGRAIIDYQLEALAEYPDIIIVVGYQAREVINKVKELRSDVTFAFNHSYLKTGTAASLKRGAKLGADYIISVDGDILFSKEDFDRLAHYEEDCIGVMSVKTDEPVYVDISHDRKVVGLSQEKESEHEWTGLVKMSRAKVLEFGDKHVFPNIVKHLPIKYVDVDCVEIDYPNDLNIMKDWLNDCGRGNIESG